MFAGGSARGAATARAGPGSAGRGARLTRPASGACSGPTGPVRNVASYQKIQDYNFCFQIVLQIFELVGFQV